MPICAKCGAGIPSTSALCPSCGAAAPEPKSRKGRGALLGVTGVVVFLIGCCLVFAVVSMRRTALKSKTLVAMGYVRTIATASHSYATDNGGYPIQETLGPAAGIEKELCPVYIKRLPPLPETGPLAGRVEGCLYMSVGRVEPAPGEGERRPAAAHFLVIWQGTDGRLDPETEELLKPAPDGGAKIWTMKPRKSVDPDTDIIWIDDGFVQAPHGWGKP